jgi:hypothetical protein
MSVPRVVRAILARDLRYIAWQAWGLQEWFANQGELEEPAVSPVDVAVEVANRLGADLDLGAFVDAVRDVRGAGDPGGMVSPPWAVPTRVMRFASDVERAIPEHLHLVTSI